VEAEMTVEVELYGRNVEITDRIRNYVNKKVAKLDRYLPGIEETRVDLEYLKSARNASDRQVAQITVRGKGFILRSEESADTMQTAIDIAVDNLQNQINRYKGKHYHGRGDGRSAAEVVEGELKTPEEEATDELGPAITRKKRFILTPMDELEALEQMRLLGHDNFFVFFNVNSNSVDVIYRRRDGSYGLIQTEVQ